MKKWIAFLCTLMCIFSLTACGGSGDAAMSQYDQDRLYEAKSYAQGLVEQLLNYFTDDGIYEAYSTYSKEELEYIMENFNQGTSILVDGHGLQSAMNSFNLSGDTTGRILKVNNVEAEIDGSQIIVNMDVFCETRDATVEVILSNDLFLRLEGASLNPKYTKSELMKKAALNTVLGMGTVFSVLILISIIIACFGVVPKIQKAMAKKKEKMNTTGIDNAVAQIGQMEENLEETDDTELVAVIAAAVAAYEGSANTDGFVVRSIRRR